MDIQNTLEKILIELEWISRGGRNKYTIYDPVYDLYYYRIICFECGFSYYDDDVERYKDLEIFECRNCSLTYALSIKKGLLLCMSCDNKILLEDSNKDYKYEEIGYFCDICKNDPKASEYIKEEEEVHARRERIWKNKNENIGTF